MHDTSRTAHRMLERGAGQSRGTARARIAFLLGGCLVAGLLLLALWSAASGVDTPPAGRAAQTTGIHEIQHVIVIMQENRSFDSYFGTYPGADGIPMRGGKPAVCVPNGIGGCVRPFHDPSYRNAGGPPDRSPASSTWTAARWTGSSGSHTKEPSALAEPIRRNSNARCFGIPT